MAFSRVSTRDSDIPSPWVMPDEPAFMSLLGNLGLFCVIAFRCPILLRLQNQCPSHIPLAEGSLIFKCLWKFDIPLDSKPGNYLSSRVDFGYMQNFQVAVVTSGSL